MAFQALRGFRDFYPEEMAVRRYIEQAWHGAARAAGFEEIDGPPLESLDLLKAKSGDAIVEEIYAFEDKGGREVGLRPEFTPTLGRMVAERAASLKKPLKWYCVPQLFRYQRQQRGRLREHIQWNVDIVGAARIEADMECVAVAVDALRRLGLTSDHVRVRINHRGVVEECIRAHGISDVEATLQLIDKGKLDESLAADLLVECRDSVAAELAGFFQGADDYGIGEFIEIDSGIVRGLAYYTGIVWEIFDRGHKLRAIAGGGRYDRLIETLGGPSMPALGFGMGDVVLAGVLEDLKLLPDRPPRLDVMVLPIGEEMAGPARRVVRHLRDRELCAEAPYSPVKLGKGFQAAEAAGARRAVIVGRNEWDDGAVTVKDLDSGEQSVVRLEDLS